MADSEYTKAFKEHTKQDLNEFKAVHDHLDRLDKATNNDLVIYKIDELQRKVELMNENMGLTYVTKIEFDPIKKLVYGMVALILMGVVGGILALVIRSGAWAKYKTGWVPQ